MLKKYLFRLFLGCFSLSIFFACGDNAQTNEPLPIIGERLGITPNGDTIYPTIPNFAFVDQNNDIEKKNKITNIKVTYEIENHNSYEVNIKLFEKIPLPRSSEVIVKNISYSQNSTYDEKNNSLLWEYKLGSTKKEINTFSYDVIYPAKSSLTGVLR